MRWSVPSYEADWKKSKENKTDWKLRSIKFDLQYITLR